MLYSILPGLSGGQISGIVIGVFLCVSILFGLVVYVADRKQIINIPRWAFSPSSGTSSRNTNTDLYANAPYRGEDDAGYSNPTYDNVDSKKKPDTEHNIESMA